MYIQEYCYSNTYVYQTAKRMNMGMEKVIEGVENLDIIKYSDLKKFIISR